MKDYESMLGSEEPPLTLENGEPITYGQYVTLRRNLTGLDITTFCERYGYKVTDISAIERDLGLVESPAFLLRLADVLEIPQGNRDAFVLNALWHSKQPQEFQTLDLTQLPLAVRTVNNRQPTPEQLRLLARKIEDAGQKRRIA